MYNISNIMTEEIFLVLMASIPHSLVSAFNTPEISAYNFEFYIDQQFFSVDLLVSYANTTPENIYVKYELILNKTLIEKQYYPILKTNKKSMDKNGVPFLIHALVFLPVRSPESPAESLASAWFWCRYTPTAHPESSP